MSSKSKKTTADRTIANEKSAKCISHSAVKTINRLSLSFYGQSTLKMQKQIIIDNYDELQNNSPSNRLTSNATSYSQGKTIESKISIIRHKKQQHKQHLVNKKIPKAFRQTDAKEDKKSNNKFQQRSSSKSSRGKKSGTHNFMNYLSNRIDISSKAWNAIRPIMKQKATINKRMQK